MDEQEKTIEITCRNCEESFSVPESALSHPDVPCSKCGFINHLATPGTFSRPKVLEKLAVIFGDGIDDGSHQGILTFFTGGTGLIVIVILAIIYSQFSGEAPTAGTANVKSSTITNSIGMELVLIPAGTYMMGSNQGAEEETPVHSVTISKPYYLGTHEVTAGQWIEVMGEQPMFQMPTDNPVLLITWEQAKQFCKKLSKMENASYRLPTEAEWEYAIRAGSNTEFYWGDLYAEGYGWCHVNSGRPTRSTHQVGSLKPNAWGLFDMSGNVGEWCEDYYSSYSTADQVDPAGPAEGKLRVVRGGDYTTIPIGLRSASRGKSAADSPGPGFRVVKNP
ncbi:MAG: formylglycine-generating enzyme family protein [Candidatus Riflebacteria bacterium]|nr:formylglycine-generating enzyme family protein [Candidatus Riflebacteria bacterium]